MTRRRCTPRPGRARLRQGAAALGLAALFFWLGTRFPAGLPFGDGPTARLTTWAPPTPTLETAGPVQSPQGSGAGAATVSINTATAAELHSVLHVRRSTAERIVRYRSHHGPFHTVEDLLAVPLSRGTVERIAPAIAFR